MCVRCGGVGVDGRGLELERMVVVERRQNGKQPEDGASGVMMVNWN